MMVCKYSTSNIGDMTISDNIGQSKNNFTNQSIHGIHMVGNNCIIDGDMILA